MKRHQVITVATVVVLTLVPAVMMAQGIHGGAGQRGQGRLGGHGGGFGFGEQMAVFLDLSTEQEAQIEQIRAAYEPIIKDLLEQKRTARQEFMQSLDPETFDEGATRLSAQSQAEFDVELVVNRAKLKAELHGVLTDEQKQQLADFKGKMAEKRAERAGRRGGRGQGGRF